MIGTLRQRNYSGSRQIRRAVVIVWTAISVTLLIGFAALAVDLGYVYVVRDQLQAAADAAAMAGVSAFASPSQFVKNSNPNSLTTLAVSRAQDYVSKNYADRKTLTLAASDITVGHLAHPEDLTDTITISVHPYNAVKCTVLKSSASSNGPVGTFFAKIWGIQNVALAASATAVLNTHLGGYKAKTTGGPLIPITIGEATWTDQITNEHGGDAYTFNYQTSQITKATDGISEINIYPGKTNPGNFGLLNFDNGNNSASTVGDQIQSGLTAAEVTRTIGSDTFTFSKDIVSPTGDVTGVPLTYAIDGTPGLKASLQSALDTRIGTVVGIFINKQVTGNGSNCVYTITGIQYGILLAADLQSGNKAVIMQPTVYVGTENVIDAEAPATQTGGRIELVR